MRSKLRAKLDKRQVNFRDALRRRKDSNLRCHCWHNSFQDCPFQPLTHASLRTSVSWNRSAGKLFGILFGILRVCCTGQVKRSSSAMRMLWSTLRWRQGRGIGRKATRADVVAYEHAKPFYIEDLARNHEGGRPRTLALHAGQRCALQRRPGFLCRRPRPPDSFLPF